MSNYRYVANQRKTVSGDDLRLEKIGPKDYQLQIRREAHRGPTTRLVGLSEDDIRALYIMLDEIVGTFKEKERKAAPKECTHVFEDRLYEYDLRYHKTCKHCGHMPEEAPSHKHDWVERYSPLQMADYKVCQICGDMTYE